MQDLDYYEQHNPGHVQLSIALPPSNTNSLELCVPSTPKVTSVDSLCRQNQIEMTKNETEAQGNGFLNRVIFDRDEILRKHYQIEKTDKELIEETLNHFNTRLVNENRTGDAGANKHTITLKPRVRSMNKQAKSSELAKRKNVLNIEKTVRNEFTENNCAHQTDDGIKVDLVDKSNKNEMGDRHAQKDRPKALVSFKNISALCSSKKRFPIEAREPDSGKSKALERSFGEAIKSNKMEFSIDNQLLKRFEEAQAIEQPNFFEINEQLESFEPREAAPANKNEQCLSINIDDPDENDRHATTDVKAKSNVVNSAKSDKYNNNNKCLKRGSSNNNKSRLKKAKFELIKCGDIKSKKIKTEAGDCDADTDSHEDAFKFMNDDSLCKSHYSTKNSECHCDKFKRMAERLNMKFDNNFARLVYDSLFQKTKEGNPLLANEAAKENNHKPQLFTRKNREKPIEIQNKGNKNVTVKEQQMAMQDKQPHRGANLQIRAKIDRLKAFKKYFMKTDRVAADLKAPLRKQSNEFNTFR